MLRNPIFGDFSGGGEGPDSLPPSGIRPWAVSLSWSLRSRYKIGRLHRHKNRDLLFLPRTLACASNTVGSMVVSCADPGIFARGEGDQKKTLITLFRHQIFYSFKEGYQWFILRKTIFLRFQGRGSKYFPGRGGQVNIELVNFRGGGGGVWTSGSAQAYDHLLLQ